MLLSTFCILVGVISAHPLSFSPSPNTKSTQPVSIILNFSTQAIQHRTTGHHTPHPSPSIRGKTHTDQIPLTFTLSRRVCTPLIQDGANMLTLLSDQLLSEYPRGISFPPRLSHTTPSPVKLEAGITQHGFLVTLSLEFSPLTTGTKWLRGEKWEHIVDTLERSLQGIESAMRRKGRAGLGDVKLEVEIEDVSVVADWKFWKVVGGKPVQCDD